MNPRDRLTAEVGRAVERICRECPAFRWGRHDCVLWAANILVAAGLPDPVPQIRGKYRSVNGALRMIGKDGLEVRTAEAAQRLGWREMSLHQHDGLLIYPDAKPGDIGIVAIPVPHMMRVLKVCVIRGPHGDWHGPIDHGCGFHQDHAVLRAWSVLQ